MRRPSTPSNYVSLILENKVRVEGVTADLARELEILGGYEETIAGELCWVIQATGPDTLGELLEKLRDQGFLFADGPAGWPPAEVFRDLRDRGHIEGDFQAVTWYGPGKWRVYTG